MSNMHHHLNTNNSAEAINFANLLGSNAGKRRRMRSGGNVSTMTNNTPKGSSGASSGNRKNNKDGGDSMQNEASASKSSRGTNTIPIFLKKTYKMVDTCDRKICSWSDDGEMFIVKDPDLFAKTIIPQYFDHNKFSSFARQLNFYGFRKMQSKPIRNADFDQDTAKHVTFYNEKFKRGRCDLLKEIQRSTRGGTASQSNISMEEHQRELNVLKTKIASLEEQVRDMNTNMDERMRRLELDMLGRMEQMMLAMQQQQQTQINLTGAGTLMGNNNTGGSNSTTTTSGAGGLTAGAATNPNPMAVPSSILGATNGAAGGGHSWDPLPFDGTSQKPISLSTTNISNTKNKGSGDNNKPTLPPHPKQKSLSQLNGNTGTGGTGMGTSTLPAQMMLPPTRLQSLRGLSQSMSRGLSVESTEFFSMLMLGNDSSLNNNNNNNGIMTGVGGNNNNSRDGITEIDDGESTKEVIMNQ